jgi:hypothetical protein
LPPIAAFVTEIDKAGSGASAKSMPQSVPQADDGSIVKGEGTSRWPPAHEAASPESAVEAVSGDSCHMRKARGGEETPKDRLPKTQNDY